MVRLAIFKWTGGKEWLWKHIKPYLIKHDSEIYIEPFLGGGSIAFHYMKYCKKHNVKKRFILSDSNEGLINVYKQIKNNVEELIKLLDIFDQWIIASRETYNYQRKLYNSTPKSTPQSAALFIWLLSNGFQGLYRCNKRGEYNTSFGIPRKTRVSPEALRSLHELFQNAEFRCCSFKEIPENGIIYLDPPYEGTYNKYTLNAPSSDDVNKFIEEKSRLSRIYLSNSKFYKPLANMKLLLKTTVKERAKVKKDSEREEYLYFYPIARESNES